MYKIVVIYLCTLKKKDIKMAVVYKQKIITKRLLAQVPFEIHAEIKDKAKRRNITITTYIMEAIHERLLRDRQYEN